MNIFLVAGARPNFMKIAPIYRESKNMNGVRCQIVHTGQHYDYEMSQAFFEDLEIPKPDFFLNAGSGSHAEQTARIMVGFEQVCMEHRPDVVLVVGDVNSTLACSIVAKKLGVIVGHVEAGLRSFDLDMPEEINRMVTDAITDLFFVTEQSGVDNLLREGKPADQVHFVGHVMIDNLLHQKAVLEGMDTSGFSVAALKERHPRYAFLTLHRPSNVDDQQILAGIVSALNEIALEMPIFFPVHPRTRKMLDTFGMKLSENIHKLSPLSFRESLFLWKDAKVVLTDSGGLQEETTALGVPCLTIRENTERPTTIEQGTNVLCGCSKDSILHAFRDAISDRSREFQIPPKWDGLASQRIWRVITDNRQI